MDHSKLAVLNSPTSLESRRVYEFAIEQFITWYCSEPRLAFNRIVVVRYRIQLEARGLAAATINQRLAAVRRLDHEAADSGLLSPELAAGIHRVKGAKQLGHRSGNFGCGLRRSELAELVAEKIQMRQGHWVIVDLVGKGGHIRSVPIPLWVKASLDRWLTAAHIERGRIFRAVSKNGSCEERASPTM
jgi:site-specific recombinase XerC